MRNLPLPFISPVAGVSFRQEVVCGTRPGDEVDVAAVDDNPHDPHAVEVRTRRGELLGFIPSAIAARLRSDDTRTWRGEIVEVLAGQTWGLRVRVEKVADTAPEPSEEPAQPAARHHDQAAVAGLEPGPGPTCGVRARSGRFLGVLDGVEGEVVVVRRPDGTLCRYPAELVAVGDTQHVR